VTSSWSIFIQLDDDSLQASFVHCWQLTMPV